MLLQVLMSDGTVEQKPLDDYLAGVILAEMPASFEEEALKAQAVVSRTYTLRQTARNKHDSADICTDPGCCQGWISYEDYCAKRPRPERFTVHPLPGRSPVFIPFPSPNRYKGEATHVFSEKTLHCHAAGRWPGQPAEGFDGKHRQACRTLRR